MAKMRIYSEVEMFGAVFKHEHMQEFDDDLNVFGRVLAYHEYMYKAFPGKRFKLIKTEEVTE